MSYKSLIRDVVDFPKPGIVFKDITPLLQDHEAFQQVISEFAQRFSDQKITKVCGIESRGFIFGVPLALQLGAGFVPIRKKGKLPYKTKSEEYSLEYGTDQIEMHVDAIQPGERVLLVDDVLATGGTASAAMRLLNRFEADVVGICFVMELMFLNGRQTLGDHEICSLIQYS